VSAKSATLLECRTSVVAQPACSHGSRSGTIAISLT